LEWWQKDSWRNTKSILLMNKATQPNNTIFITLAKQSSRKLTLLHLKLEIFTLWTLLILLIVTVSLYPSMIRCHYQILKVAFGESSVNLLHIFIFTTCKYLIFEFISWLVILFGLSFLVSNMNILYMPVLVLQNL
jgi:hypothetical protein